MYIITLSIPCGVKITLNMFVAIGSAQLVLLIVHSTFLESMRLGELDECKKVYLVSGFFCYSLLEVLHGLSFTNVRK